METWFFKFLTGQGVDDHKRSFDELLHKKSDFYLEVTHSYIQRVFPLDEPSGADPTAPVLTAEDVAYLKNIPAVTRNISRMYRRMLRFYKMDDEHLHVLCIRCWNYPMNHNWKRMTRMLKCFKLLEMDDERADFTARLKYLDSNGILNISKKTREIWGF